MMRHCRQCRADAVGLLGEDRSAEFTTDKIMAMEVNYDLDTRKAYQAKVEEERAAEGRRQAGGALDAGRREERHQAARRGRHQGLGPDQRALRPRQGVPDLRAVHGGREVRRPSPRRSLLPGRLRRRGQPRDRHPRDQRLPCGVRGQDRRLSEGGPDRRPGSSRSTSSRTSSSRNRRSPGSSPISTRSTAARSSTSSAAMPRSVRVH